MNPTKLPLPSVLLTIFIVLLSIVTSGEAGLSSTFYDNNCPKALTTIRTAVSTAIARERRMAASLIRLHFHDCFVQGCDASVLLNDTATMEGEKTALQNLDSLRGFDVIDAVKSKVEDVCPGVVSCADILAVAARDASVYVGGPTWTVKLGRRDSISASKTMAQANLPFSAATLSELVENFRSKGLSAREMVTLSGAHTLGQARCVTFRDRLYGNATAIDAGFLSTRKRKCPATGDNGNLAALDLVTPNSFDNNYFKNLIQKKGLLTSDQVLFNGGSTDTLVTEYSKSRATFYSDFVAAMIKMGDITPLTGSSGQIRKICSAIN